MGKVMIAYATRTKHTESIAELIAEGIRMSGHEAVLKRSNEIKSGEDISGFDAYIFGSPTYHGEMVNGMKQFLFMAESAELEGKPAGSFGSYGWSGEAAGRIFDTMEHIFKMKMVSDGPLMLKTGKVQGGIRAAQDYGKNIAAMIES